MLRPSLAAAFLSAALAAPAGADDGLADLLRYVPIDAVAREIRAPVALVDMEEIRAVALVGVPLMDRFGWTAEDRELAALSRVRAMPMILYDYAQYFAAHEFASTRDYLGFGWEDIQRAVGFGLPPDHVVAATGAPALSDSDTIGAVLSARGFSAEQRRGFPFWGRLADNELDIENRDPADPLRGHLGGSARAGVVDGAFVAAANWPAIDSLVSAFVLRRTLATAPDFTAVVHALGQPVTGAGALLQAHLMAGAFDADFVLSLLRGEDEAGLAELRAQLLDGGDGPRTPRYRAIGIGDRQEGAMAVGVVALVYADRADAALATETVPQAIAAQVSLATNAPFSELLPYDLSTAVVEAPGGDRFVAVISLAFAMPRRSGPLDRAPTPFQRLTDMLYRGDMGPFSASD